MSDEAYAAMCAKEDAIRTTSGMLSHIAERVGKLERAVSALIDRDIELRDRLEEEKSGG